MISVTVARQATAVAAFTIALGCGYDSTTPYPQPGPGTSVRDGLWTASGINPAILRLEPTQLLSSGSQLPATAISTSSAELSDLNGIAFDIDGTMWVTSVDDSTLIAFPPASLERSGPAPAAVVISSNDGSLSAPRGLAFDKQHRLWVANVANGSIVRLDPAQLRSSGSPVPTVTITGLGQPVALAFDAAGSLWYSDARRNKVASFAEDQLDASGFLAPRVVVSSKAASLANPLGIAFDANGNLWVGNVGNQTVVGFSPTQLVAGGTIDPNVVLSSNGGSLNIPAGLAFDADGSLWVMGGTGALEKFPKSALNATGAPAPGIHIDVAGYVLFSSVAFWPTPESLPIN